MPHPLVAQLHFARSEFIRALAGVTDQDARQRLPPMNCISWNIGHLAWQEQRYFVTFAQGNLILPELNTQFAYGAPACTPALADIHSAWQRITAAADVWLDQVTSAELQRSYTSSDNDWTTAFGNLVQRVIYHYWYHTGENMAIRQQLGHGDLPEFVGELDTEAPYQP